MFLLGNKIFKIIMLYLFYVIIIIFNWIYVRYYYYKIKKFIFFLKKVNG